jgi:hypothetical protein
MRTSIFICATIVALACTAPAAAANISIASSGHPPPAWVHVTGEFKAGDDVTFESYTIGLTDAIVVLESPGGDPIPAMNIGLIIRKKNFTTLAWRRCASACATAWLGGAKRMMFADTRLGFHAVFNSNDRTDSGLGNALLGAYLNKLGLSVDAIRFVTKEGADGMSYLTPAEAQRLGINVELVSPSAALVLPTVQPEFAAAPRATPAPQPAALPPQLPPMPERALPACESAAVKNELMKIGNSRGVAVFNIFSATLVNAGDMEMCTALAWTTAGKLAVTYTVNWTNRQAGLFWVQVTSYRRTW